MNNVISLKERMKTDVDAAFICLLNDYCLQKEIVQPIPSNFLTRIENLKEKAEESKCKANFLLEA